MIGKISDIYRSDGLRAVFEAIWIKALLNNYLYIILDSILGSSIHEKVVMGPIVGYWPNISQPRSFNEKIVHRKIYTDIDLFSTVSDKFAVRDFVSDRVDFNILTDLYHVTDNPETIPFDDLPNKFVVKSNHGQGMNIIVEDKTEIDREEIRSQCRKWLNKSVGKRQREYWYEQITPRIIVEELLQNEDETIPNDYKFYVFHGEVQYIHIDVGRFNNHQRRFYDDSWNALDIRRRYPLAPEIEKPPNFQRMKSIAETLGEGFDFARIDLYNLGDNGVIFGEVTLAPGSGHARFEPKEADFEFGQSW